MDNKINKTRIQSTQRKQSRAFEDVPEQRRRIMSSIGRKNTRPEMMVRSIVHKMGYRFTVNGPLNRTLPGRPDIVLPGRKSVIFVHGCFWHGHTVCGKYHPTKTRREFWHTKIKRNRNRDRIAVRSLIKMKWIVIVVWECDLRLSKINGLKKRLKKAIPSNLLKQLSD